MVIFTGIRKGRKMIKVFIWYYMGCEGGDHIIWCKEFNSIDIAKIMVQAEIESNGIFWNADGDHGIPSNSVVEISFLKGEAK